VYSWKEKASSILTYAYNLLGDIVILINNGGTLEEKPLKELWQFASNKKTG
jgi:hypothetical protein